MISQDIPFMSAAEIAAAIRSKQVSPVEAVQSYLERIDRLDSNLKAYITVCREEALDAARQAEQAVQRGDASGPLFGVPMAVKDQFWTENILTTNGSRAYKDFVPEDDATVIKGIKAAGAILLGKLNLSELAMGGTQSPPWGIPRNPWETWSALQASPAVALEWRYPPTCAHHPWGKIPAVRVEGPRPIAMWWACDPLSPG